MTYTYTTEEIRDCYHGCTHDCADSHDRANFDLWLTEYTRQAKEQAWREGATLTSNIYPLDPDNHNPYRSQE